ncbi:oxidoreductase [Anaerocolumna sedimenticola]|uniref:Oxidoreductase n=1 Tax=Anaerocolumna sedimenticola TaxID=2696063 RepID=A0A6P1TS45_9FIRM|nr:aldo/keto reductase [Anaerocolumna sedimenticola]QHQ62315.1 oxidoreductase [Anaerocolumna sedimenticola]
MIYKPFQELQLSTLGMGNMRLPTIDKHGPIDELKARAIIENAYENGVNYFDTAYRYHEGESEKFVGKVLNQYPRESWYLASKMPGHMMQYKNGKLEFIGYLSGMKKCSTADIFEEQLEKCGVEYFDFYLLHNLCETSYDFYTDEDLGIVEYLLAQKQAGRIRHLGFSAHGRAETIEKFLKWKDCFEFAQIQLNYMDWFLQDAGRKYEILTNHGIPVIVMEPCRGGKLANLNEKANNLLKKERPNDSIASWAFRYLQSLPNIQTVLSGMTTMEQLKENIDIFSQNNPTTAYENKLLNQVVSTMINLIPCTACRYCCEGCPQGLDIPKLLSMYNESTFDNPSILKFTLDAMKNSELPGACLNCGACKKLCPQNIDIPDILKKFDLVLCKNIN